MVANPQRTELKCVDWPIKVGNIIRWEQPLSATANFALINGVQEGSAYYNRVGRKIVLKSLHVTGQVQTLANLGIIDDGGFYGRLLIVYDRQPEGVIPAIATVLSDYDQTGATASTPISGLNPTNAERFLILRDLRFAFSSTDNQNGSLTNIELQTTDYTTNRVNVNEYIRLNNLETTYKSDADPATIANVSAGAIYAITFGTSADANAVYGVSIKARLRYTDA